MCEEVAARARSRPSWVNCEANSRHPNCSQGMTLTSHGHETSYLGIRLPHPFVAGASPFGYHLDTIKRLEDAGCAAVVLHSLFEEQITEQAGH